MSVAAGLRRFWLNVHLWIGAVLFVPFAVLGISGVMLLWEDPIEHQLYPQRYHVSVGPSALLQTDLDHARAAFGDEFAVVSLRLPQGAGDPLIVQARAKGRPAPGERPQTRNAWIDPATARVLDTGSGRDTAFGLAHDLHGQLKLPQNGRFWVGWLGVAMSLSALTGFGSGGQRAHCVRVWRGGVRRAPTRICIILSGSGLPFRCSCWR